jgi:membrane protease subunit (stomatin/prohibitin family)
MGALGDMSAYMQFQAARAMRDAAQQPGGEAGTGVGLGAGIGMGATMAQMLTQSMQQPAQPATPAAPAAPKTAAEIQATLDNLDMRLAAGEISEETYNKLYAKWEARLKASSARWDVTPVASASQRRVAPGSGLSFPGPRSQALTFLP